MATIYRPRGTRWFYNLFGSSGKAWTGFDSLGHVVSFIAEVIRTVPHAIKHYRSQIMYILTDITWGRGALVVGGGTAPVLAVLGITVGAIVAVQGFAILNMLGMGPLTAVAASFANTREFAPLLAGVGFAAQAGCRMTAEIGAMRINEEIDALESLGLRSVSFVVTTRVLAGLVAVIPVYLITLILSWLSCAWMVTTVYGMPTGTYQHYFSQFVSASDIFFSVIKVAVFLVAVIIIHCYQGFFASGGPEGVGTASGRAIRASLVAVVILNLVMTVALWGFSSPVYFKG
ncbi:MULTISPECIES: ABC transporter permease [Tsukamurella]|uniref:ABC transporter permease n=1 Tax=Tsukamurella strandjordii TaxID=147577 RepID=A0AA90NDA7_9ACTN|nr:MULTISPECIES: ABC transporter permease [Tsukamurella]MDP0400216.1 ABC transporter permease [Tsukamurella strandjordii]GIZ98544.1 putative YrbE family protein [Tsukamurella sp. TY48]